MSWKCPHYKTPGFAPAIDVPGLIFKEYSYSSNVIRIDSLLNEDWETQDWILER